MSHKSFEVIMKVTGLGMSIEEVQHMLILNQDLRIQDSLK